MLEQLDTEKYQLVIVEGEDYKQPLYSQIVQFSTLFLDSYYDSKQINLLISCIYPNLKILSKKDDIKNAIALSCSKSLTGAHCELPSVTKFGFYNFYIGDKFINTAFISNSFNSSTII